MKNQKRLFFRLDSIQWNSLPVKQLTQVKGGTDDHDKRKDEEPWP